MRKIVEEVEGEGLQALLGKQVEVWCECYIYTGKLIGVNDTCILLQDASIVYETGPLQEPGYKNVEKLRGNRYIQVAKIEMFGEAG